jgi:hypothetical protein
VVGAGADSVTQPVTATPTDTGAPAETGLGIDGMRRRLESVGGRLDVRRRLADDTPTFTVTAWIPLRPVAVPGGRA